MHAAKILHHSVAEYLAMENDGEQRHEFLNGEILAMTGASIAHNQIAVNLVAVLRNHLRGSGCRVYANDMKLEVAQANCFFYPDLFVACDDKAAAPGGYYYSDADLIIEILSGSTEQRDQEFKRLTYQRLPSLQEYVLIRQDRRSVSVYRRLADGWEFMLYDSDEDVELESIDLALAMPVIYEDVVFFP